MKKILCLVLFVGFAYSLTGNLFIEKYPFGKTEMEMTDDELTWYTLFHGYLKGFIAGNTKTLDLLELDEEAFDAYLLSRICGMTHGQHIRIIKKWCDDNPERTHLPFSRITYTAFLNLQPRSVSECAELEKNLKLK